MTILVRGAASTGAQTTSPATIDVSALGIQANDLVLLHVRFSTNIAPTSLPDGFTLVAGSVITPQPTIHIYSKIATASEPSSYDVGFVPGSCRLGVLVEYSDVSDSLQINAVSNRSFTGANYAWHGVSTSGTNAFLACFASLAQFASPTPQTGMTTRYNLSGTDVMYCMTGYAAEAGGTGIRTATAPSQSNVPVVMIAVVEASQIISTTPGAWWTDFSEYPLGNLHDNADWEEKLSNPGSVNRWEVVADALAAGGKVARFTQNDTEDGISIAWLTPGMFVDGEVLTRVRVDTSQRMSGVCLRLTETGTYWAAIRIGFPAAIHRYDGNVETVLATGPSQTANVFYWLRFNVTGTTLKAKIWEDGTSEPTTGGPDNDGFQMKATDTFYASGFSGISGPLGTVGTVAQRDNDIFGIGVGEDAPIEDPPIVFRRPTLQPPLRTHLFLLRPAVVLAAQVAMDTIVYPIDTVLIDAITVGDPLLDVREGMTVVFGSTAGASDLGRTYIRKQPQTLAAGEALIYTGLCSRGTRDGEIDISDGVHVTVWDDYRVWAKPQVFVPNGAGGVDIFKDSDIPVWRFSGGGAGWTDQPPPVANSGPWLGAVAIGGTFTFPMSASGSFPVAESATLSAYLWDVVDGTIVTGSTSTAAISVQFPVGYRWVNVFITDSNGRTHRSRTLVVVIDPDNPDTIAHEIVTQRLTAERQELSVRVLADIPAGTYPDGTAALLWEGEALATTDLTRAHEHMRFAGWLDTQGQSIQGSREGTLRDSTLTLLDIAGRMAQLPAYAHEVAHVAGGPSTWLEMRDASIFKYIHYLLHWHSTVLGVADWLRVPQGAGNVAADAADYDFIVLGSAASDLLDQVRTVARSLVPDYEWVTNMWSQMYLRVDPLLLDAANRSNQVAGLTLDASRYTSLEFEHLPTPRVRAVYGGAVLSSHTPPIQAVFARAPGDTLGQGLQETRNENQLALSQADLNAAEGHRYARLNAPESLFRPRMARAAELWSASFGPQHFQPAGTRWVRLSLPAAIAAQRGLSFTDARFLMREMVLAYAYPREGAQRSVELALERETAGPPAVTYTLDVPMGWTPQIWLRGGVDVGDVVAAYEPFRAADLANSYINLHNPGTNNAAPGVAPTFAAGWVFDGSTQWLTTGMTPAAGWSMIVALEDATGSGTHVVSGSTSGAGSAFYLMPRDSADGGSRRYGVGNALISVAADAELAAGVMGIDGGRAWLDTLLESDATGTWTAANTHEIYIGGLNDAGTAANLFAGRVTHAYYYSAPLTPYQMYAVMQSIQADLGS